MGNRRIGVYPQPLSFFIAGKNLHFKPCTVLNSSLVYWRFDFLLDEPADDDAMPLRERIEHIRFTLADMCLEKSTDRFSFFRLLNRVVFFFQEPLIFAICRKSPNSDGYVVDRHTHGDPLYRDEFEAALQSLQMKQDLADVPEVAIAPYAIQLFKSSFFIIPFEIDRNLKANFVRQRVKFVPVKRDAEVSRILQRIFRPFGSALSSLEIEAHIENNFQSIFQNSAQIEAYLDDPRKDPANRQTLKVMARYEKRHKQNKIAPIAQGELALKRTQDFESGEETLEPRADFTCLEELLESEMALIASSPALYSGKSQVSNILISRKKFDRSDLRFDSYFYSIDLFISREQTQQFRICCQTVERENLQAFNDKEADDWYWACVDEGKTRTLLSMLRVPMSKHCRLFSEYSLMSGASIINVDPFSRGDIGWVDDTATDEQRSQELKRFVVLHYLLQMMSPNAKVPSLLTLPIRVSGATWMAATIVVDGSCSEEEPFDKIVSSSEFQKRFLVYHSMMRDFENRLRRKSKSAYLQCIYSVFSEQVAEMRQRRGQSRSGEPIDRNDFSEEDFDVLVNKTLSLARLYPYDLIVFSRGGALERIPDMRSDNLGHACNVDFGIYDGNPYFDRLKLRQFLDRTEVKRLLRNMVNAQLGLAASIPGIVKSV
jgi:hypothetical protein